MEQVANIAYDAITRYYNALSKLGYLKQSTVNGLVVLCFIEEFMNMFPFDITEKDYTTILKAIECLAGSNCLIDFPTYSAYVDTVSKYKNYNLNKHRITEDSIIRIAESNSFRVIN